MFGGLAEIIFFAVLAVFVAYRLNNVLGRKDFHSEDEIKKKYDENEKIMRFPDAKERTKTEKEQAKVIDAKIVEEQEKEPQPFAQEVEHIHQFDKGFTVEQFTNGAKGAFEMILDAFAKGNRDVLKNLLDEKLFGTFAKDIESREKKGVVMESTLVSHLTTDVKEIVFNKNIASIKVEFLTEQINLLKDKKGDIVEGDVKVIDQVKDLWTFSKDLTSKDPTWQLVKTEG